MKIFVGIEAQSPTHILVGDGLETVEPGLVNIDRTIVMDDTKIVLDSVKTTYYRQIIKKVNVFTSVPYNSPEYSNIPVGT